LINKSSLIIRLTIALALSSFLFGVIYSKLYYKSVYADELARSKTTIEQIGQTVSTTASIAAYLEDADLAIEVLNGLISNDVILAAKIDTDTQTLAKSLLYKGQPGNQFVLSHPFIPTANVGVILLVPNEVFIRQQASSIASDSVETLVLLIIPMLILFVSLAYIMITRPMGVLFKQLLEIPPGESQRLRSPANHKDSEIGQVTKSINHLLDKTQSLFNQERELRKAISVLEQRFRLMFERASTPTLLVKSSGLIELANDAAQDLLVGLNVSAEETFPECLMPLCKSPDSLDSLINDATNQGQVKQMEIEFESALTHLPVWLNIVIIPTESEEGLYLQIFINDVSYRRNMINELKQKAQFDPLTNLNNRYGAELKLRFWLDNQIPFALLLVDLDKFKPINDIYGHNAGDEMLKHIAANLKECVRNDDLVARWGGDEFIVAVPHIAKDGLQKIASHLVAKTAMPMPYEKDNQSLELKVSASIGIACYPDHAETLHELIEKADNAMYSVKLATKNDFAFYHL